MNVNETSGITPHLAPDPDDQGLAFGSTDGPLGVDGSFDPLAGTGTVKKSHGGSILIVAVILVAVAGVFSMRKLAQVTAATGIDREIEATIEKFISSLSSTGGAGTDSPATSGPSEEILAVLGTAYTEIQVPLQDVQKDPFVISDAQPTTVADPVSIDPAELTAQQERRWKELQDERRADLERTGRAMSLKAILGGSTPLAIINGKTLGVGATITDDSGDEFRVIEIGATSVDLFASAPELNVEVTVTLHLKRDR